MKFNYFWALQRRVWQLQEQAQQAQQAFCGQHGITPQQLRVLLILYHEGAQSASSLAKSAGMAPANLSAMAKRLLADGLMLRQRSAEDERQVLMQLSPKGEELMHHFAESWEKWCRAFVSRIDATEWQAAEQCLEKLGRCLDEENTAPQKEKKQ